MNKVFIIGNLAKDPELKTTPNGVSVCRFTVAVNRTYKDQNGERQADFIPVVAWRGLAENCAKYISKGRKVAVCGEIQTRTYDAQDGTKRYVTEVVASDVEFLSPNPNAGGYGNNSGNDFGNVNNANNGDQGNSDSYRSINDDEIPF